MTVFRRLSLPVPAVCLAALLSAASPTMAASGEDSKAIGIAGFAFAPAQLTVTAGTKVTWTNHDEEPHTVMIPSEDFRSDALDTDQGFSFVFDRPGTYRYFCTIHPQMTGVITVVPKG